MTSEVSAAIDACCAAYRAHAEAWAAMEDVGQSDTSTPEQIRAALVAEDETRRVFWDAEKALDALFTSERGKVAG